MVSDNHMKNGRALRIFVGISVLVFLVSSSGASTGPAYLKNFTNSIGMDFVLIPVGEFDMGSPSSEEPFGRLTDEGPVHHVKISKSFYMGKFVVTQKQWRDVMGTNPSNFKGDNLPVESVSWNDAQEFINKLNEKEGTNKYRLPSEAEWEYSARAGTTTRYFFGDDKSKLSDYAWYDGDSGSNTHEVGQKKSNPWGLYDIYGNVWEMVQDIYHGSYEGAPTDGSAWEGDGPTRVFRPRCWYNDARACRSSARFFFDPGTRDSHRGFRLVMDISNNDITPAVSPTSISKLISSLSPTTACIMDYRENAFYSGINIENFECA